MPVDLVSGMIDGEITRTSRPALALSALYQGPLAARDTNRDPLTLSLKELVYAGVSGSGSVRPDRGLCAYH